MWRYQVFARKLTWYFIGVYIISVDHDVIKKNVDYDGDNNRDHSDFGVDDARFIVEILIKSISALMGPFSFPETGLDI